MSEPLGAPHSEAATAYSRADLVPKKPPTRAERADLATLARGCQLALEIAGDARRLQLAEPEELTIAAALLARALDQADRVSDWRVAHRSDAVHRLEVAGQAIGAELRRRVNDVAETRGS
jgi:hypothetical protein